MSLTYAWAINSLKLKDETNHEGATLNRAVYQTHWTITGTNSAGQSGSWAGATPLSAANVPAGSFVAFDDLTEDTVIGWIRNIVENDEAYMEHITERLTLDIEEKFGTTEEIEEKALPWAAPADAEAEAEAPADDSADDGEE